MSETIYKASPFLSKSEFNGHKKIQHTLTQRSFVLDNELFSVIKSIENGKGKEAIINLLNQITDKERAEENFTFLLKNGIIINTDNEPLYYLKKSSYTLFGLKEGDVNERNIIQFVGLPISQGNNTNISSFRFPAHIRQNTSFYNITSNPEAIFFNFVNKHINSLQLIQLIKENGVKDVGDLLLNAFEDKKVVLKKIESITVDIASSGSIPFFIGGDHLISYPVISALSKIHKNLQVIHFDAHTDTYKSQLNVENQDELLHHGNFMSRCLKEEGVCKVIQIGIRGISNLRQTSPDPKQVIITPSEFENLLTNEKWLNNLIDPTLPSYITFDIDFVDHIYVPGTGNPVIGGPSVIETYNILNKVLKQLNCIVGVDIVEVNPELDERNKTSDLAATIILTLLSYLKNEN